MDENLALDYSSGIARFSNPSYGARLSLLFWSKKLNVISFNYLMEPVSASIFGVFPKNILDQILEQTTFEETFNLAQASTGDMAIVLNRMGHTVNTRQDALKAYKAVAKEHTCKWCGWFDDTVVNGDCGDRCAQCKDCGVYKWTAIMFYNAETNKYLCGSCDFQCDDCGKLISRKCNIKTTYEGLVYCIPCSHKDKCRDFVEDEFDQYNWDDNDDDIDRYGSFCDCRQCSTTSDLI